MPSTALAASANANAAAAQAVAARARRTACMKFVDGYEHDAATVVEMREYAACVGVLHPRPISEMPREIVWAIKGAILLVFVGAVIGAVIFSRDTWSGPIEGPVMGAIVGAACAAGALLALSLVAAGVGVLFA